VTRSRHHLTGIPQVGVPHGRVEAYELGEAFRIGKALARKRMESAHLRIAARHAGDIVHDGRQLTAVSALARAEGVRRGMRRRQAQGVCPELVLLPADDARDVRLFEPVAAAAETVVAGIEVVRAGMLLLPAGGASRYHGSEDALAEKLIDAVAAGSGHECAVGTADGLLAAVLAARTGAVVPPGASAAYLAPRAMGELVHAAVTDEAAAAVAQLVDLLHRLGLRQLGHLAALPPTDVHARFGRLGAWAQPWLGDAKWALPSVTATYILQNFGFSVVLFLSALTQVVQAHRGVISQFAGDAIFILFGAPKSYGADAERAVRCAWEMMLKRERMNGESAVPLRIGIGIASGEMVAGCIGAESRNDYVVVGERVNLAARLCSSAAAGEILIDEETRIRAGDAVTSESLQPLSLKGFSQPVPVCRILGVRNFSS